MNLLPLYQAFAVLAPDRTREHLFVVHGRQGAQDLGLLIANHIGVKRNGRFHCGQRNELEDMIRNHVAQGSRGVVIHAALLHAHGF